MRDLRHYVLMGILFLLPWPGQAGVADELAAAQQAYRLLDFDEVLAPAQAVLDAAEAHIEDRMQAYYLLGSALAVIGDVVNAEKNFRYLLRGKPDFDVPPKTTPKIVAIFRKVQAEEQSIRQQVRALELKRLRESLTLENLSAEVLTGGYPLEFKLRLKDPRQAVEAMRVHYRKEDQGDFSALALKPDI
ncbi:MAG: hypothetical protein QGI45_16735, partial [Myxococcota bacterium]|nr:hypothetical protein [Myxococcota bacterium]